MKKMKPHILSAVLAFVLTFSMVVSSVMAAEVPISAAGGSEPETEAASESEPETEEASESESEAESASEPEAEESAAAEEETEDETESETVPEEAAETETDTPEETETEEESESGSEEETETTAGLLSSMASTCAHGNDADTCAVCEVEALIDELPTVDELAEMDTDEQDGIYTKASDICDAYYELTKDEQDQVSNINALWEVLDYFSSGISVMAENTGAFTITGGDDGADYSYSSGTLTIRTDTALTISTLGQTSDHIVVASGVEANIILAGVDIKTSGSSPLDLNEAGESTITLQTGTTNTLDASDTEYAGIWVPDGYLLMINGSGSLTAKGASHTPGSADPKMEISRLKKAR